MALEVWRGRRRLIRRPWRQLTGVERETCGTFAPAFRGFPRGSKEPVANTIEIEVA